MNSTYEQYPSPKRKNEAMDVMSSSSYDHAKNINDLRKDLSASNSMMLNDRLELEKQISSLKAQLKFANISIVEETEKRFKQMTVLHDLINEIHETSWSFKLKKLWAIFRSKIGKYIY